MGAYDPTPEDRFTFGLWTVGNPGADPFGDPVREPMDPVHIVRRLSELGAWGVNLHDNDLVPMDASPRERDRIVQSFKQALEDHGMVVPMATTNLFTHPVFRDGAFTSQDPDVRDFALRKTMRGIDLGVELGASTYVFWGGREGTEVDAAHPPDEALKRYREAINYLCEYVKEQGYDLRFALEPKPNEPRGHLYLPTVGSMLAFIETLEHPGMVGVNPEVAHETMSGLNMHHQVAQALEADKMFHIDLNDQEPGRYDQDFRFGAKNLKRNFFLVKLLEDTGWEGPRHFDAHALRTEDEEGVWDFAAGCMRTYLILREKAREFREDEAIQSLLEEIRSGSSGGEAAGGYDSGDPSGLLERSFDPDALADGGARHERLDQLVNELLLGVRD